MKKYRKYLVIITVIIVTIRFNLIALVIDSSFYPPVNQTDIIKDLDQLTPKTREKAEEFLELCENEGLDVIITETYRTQKRQNNLYAQGRTAPGDIVTWTDNSFHTKRRAFDFAKGGDDPYGDLKFFQRCAEIGESIGLDSGIHYGDGPHLEYNPWWYFKF